MWIKTKNAKQTLENAQYKLEIIFKLKLKVFTCTEINMSIFSLLSKFGCFVCSLQDHRFITVSKETGNDIPLPWDTNKQYVKYIWNNSYLNCGCGWKWRMIITVNFQFKQLERRSLKKSGLQQDLNLWPPRYWCDALPTELWSYEATKRDQAQFIERL